MWSPEVVVTSLYHWPTYCFETWSLTEPEHTNSARWLSYHNPFLPQTELRPGPQVLLHTEYFEELVGLYLTLTVFECFV